MTSKTLRTIVLAAFGVIAAAMSARAETLMMPNRDALRSVQLVIWGVTTFPNHTVALPTTYDIDFGDGTAHAAGNVTDRSYINTTHTYGAAGTYTVTMTVTNGANTEVATTEVRVVDPAAIGGAGAVSGAVGSGSHPVYRDVRINMAIQDGLRYLWVNQFNRTANFPNGTMVSWSSNQRQWTAFAITAFENHGYRLPSDPAVAPTGIYEKYLVQKGLNFLVNGLTTVSLANQATSSAPGQPAPRNACVGIGIEAAPCTGLTDPSANPGYSIGIAMMPLAASSALNRVNGAFGNATWVQNKTYREILQRLANTLSHGQIDANVAGRGGWGYTMNTTVSDGSVMGWAILGLLDAEAATIVVPDFVKQELPYAIAGGWNSNGSFDYNADNNAAAQNLTGMEKAGIPLQGMFMIGEVGGARVDTTVDYISDRWNAASRVAPDSGPVNCGTAPKNKSCSYSMFNNFKGLKLQNIQTLPGVGRAAGPGAIPANDWHADYEDWFVNNQINPTANNGGQWTMVFSNYASNDTNANVAIAELILSNVALVLPDADKFATVGLSPALATAVEGNSHTVTAKAESEDGAPVAGATVNFVIISGPNAGLTFSGVTNASGQVSWTYTDAGPIPSFGTDRIRASIGALQSNIAEMVWTPFNRPPAATSNSYGVDEDSTLNGNVVSDAPADSDPDNDELNASVETGVSHGTLTLLSSGAFQYTPNANYCGPDSFTYSVNDGMYDSDPATVSINVVCVNDAPIADDASVATIEDTPVSGTVSSSDIDGGAPVYSLAANGANGVAVVDASGNYTYTPNADFCGTDSFTFSVSDGTDSDTGTVTVTVECANDAPIANDGAADTDEDTAVSGVATSSDSDGPSATYALAGGASNGSVAVDGSGAYTYTPNANFCGTDTFSFSVSDGSASDTGTITITVRCVNDAPVANDGSVTTAEDTPVAGSVTASDVDGPSAIFAVASAPSNGTVTINPDGSYVYTPNANYNGPDSFTFTVSDGAGGSDTGEIAITVTPVNDVPFCEAAAPSVALIWPPNHQLVNVDVLGVTDPVEQSAITITITGIWQDEPTNTQGDGNTPIDGYGVGSPTAQVRAERSGNKKVPGDGRTYHIFFTGTDAQGGTCTGSVKVGVPHDQGNGNSVTDGGPLYKSTGS